MKGATLLLVALASAVAFAPRALLAQVPREARPVRGIFALSDEGKPLPDRVVNHTALTGISLRARWADLQPKADAWQWSFDAEIARARKANKQVMLRVAPGDSTPAWVYEAGAQRFRFTPDNRYQDASEEKSIPVPWDPVLLRHWHECIKALGKKYAAEESVVLVHMSGPNRAGAEMHLPKSKADKAAWAKLGYKPERLVAAWKATIDVYAAAFPRQALALNVALPIEDDGVVDQVLAYAHERLGKRLHVQHNALSARTEEKFRPQRWVRSAADKTTIGFQLLCPVTPRGRFNDDGKRFGGNLADGFRIGLHAGAAYFEVYPVDLQQEATAKAIRDLAERLKR